MLLSDLLEGVKIKHTSKPDILPYLYVTGIASDSRRVKGGSVFVCINGTTCDGHEYVKEAQMLGASAIVSEKPINSSLPTVTVEDTKTALAYMWYNLYKKPTQNISTIAVTGTNGKTSVTYLIREILLAAGVRCGMIGGVSVSIGRESMSLGGTCSVLGKDAAMTTPDPEYFYGAIHEMRKNGATCVIFEASSHALAQRKLDPITPSIAVFTGLSEEHLDYHVTMENYAQAKSLLFRGAKRCIINADSPYALQMVKNATGKVTFVSAQSRNFGYGVQRIKYCPDSVSYMLRTPRGKVPVRFSQPGHIGIYNSLLACTAAEVYGAPRRVIAEAVKNFRGVPGRMETVYRGSGIRIIKDYAHTPEAMRCALSAAKQNCSGELIAVFGCGGDRDRTKRAVMGKIASELADAVYITEDNSRSERREDIIDEIYSGVTDEYKCKKIPDRAEAIAEAIKGAKTGDTVILLGKGHENYEIDANGKHLFDETETALEAVRLYHEKDY